MESKFSRRLRLKRRERGLTQWALADASGADRKMMSYYEAGKAQPKLDSLMAIAQVLQCSLDWLVGLKENE